MNRCSECWSEDYVTNNLCAFCTFIAIIEEMTGLIHISKTLLSDHWKDVFGSRPGHYKSWWIKQELQAEHDSLDSMFEDEYFAAQQEQEEAIQAAIQAGAADRETALRWLTQAEEGEAA